MSKPWKGLKNDNVELGNHTFNLDDIPMMRRNHVNFSEPLHSAQRKQLFTLQPRYNLERNRELGDKLCVKLRVELHFGQLKLILIWKLCLRMG